MLKIFEYLGIDIYFYSNEHEPIHVHARYNGCESKAELIVVDGKVVEVRIREVNGMKPLSGKPLQHLKDFLEVYADHVVQKWIAYFVLHTEITLEKIQGKVK